MTLFKGYARRYGVLYPLQTFSRARAVDFSSLPLFPEANSPEDMELLCRVAQRLSKEVHPLDSERRKTLHLAAVFACNFTNHMYALAGKLLTEQQIPMHVLHPLIDETAAKIHTLTPSEAQTGPAVRYDENVMNNHLAMLSDPDMQSIYRLMSQHIHKEATNHE